MPANKKRRHPINKTDCERFEDFVASYPPKVQKMIWRHPPDRKYKLKIDAGFQIVSVYSYSEDGTVTVVVDSADNPHLICVILGVYTVFGVNPDDLSEMPKGENKCLH